MDYPLEDWQRLGKLLRDRRIWLGYKRRATFAHAKGESHDRILADVEKARRDNYRPSTIARLEEIYELAPGSIEWALEGGELVTVEATTPERGRRARLEDFSRDELLDEIARREREEIEREQQRRLLQELRSRGVIGVTEQDPAAGATVTHEIGHIIAQLPNEVAAIVTHAVQMLTSERSLLAHNSPIRREQLVQLTAAMNHPSLARDDAAQSLLSELLVQIAHVAPEDRAAAMVAHTAEEAFHPSRRRTPRRDDGEGDEGAATA